MKTRRYFSLLALVSIGFLLLGTGVMASGGRGGGGGGGGNGGDGGDEGSTKDLGDLVILYRDADGVPIPSPEIAVEDPETGLSVMGGLCWQPIAFPSTTCTLDCTGQNPCLVPVDQYSCAVETAYAGCTKEVDFGRTNEARSPDDVFQSQLEDVIVNLATADCVTLDPAGRLVTSRVADDGTVTTNAIDSPLQNLAIYREIILKGSLGALLSGNDIYDTAARALGAASDKSGGIDVDQVAYLNQIMGLSDPETLTAFGKICEDYREEVQGEMEYVEKCFLDYGAFGYDREDNFGSLPAPAYIPAVYPEEGWFEYMIQLSDYPPTFGIMQGPILDALFCLDENGDPIPPSITAGECDDPNFIDPGLTSGNIGGFAQAADDTRAVIEFMHLYPVLPDFATPLLCTASGDINYDVSISDVSGLQVPKNIVNGSEGREFTVTVANAGPDAASGTVMVTASYGNDSLTDSPWSFTFTDLPVGVSESFVEFFTVNIVDIVPETTITWTGTVIASEDVNESNNEVHETSRLIVTGGGSRK